MGRENANQHLQAEGNKKLLVHFLQKAHLSKSESGQEFPNPQSGATNSIYLSFAYVQPGQIYTINPPFRRF